MVLVLLGLVKLRRSQKDCRGWAEDTPSNNGGTSEGEQGQLEIPSPEPSQDRAVDVFTTSLKSKKLQTWMMTDTL